MVERIEERLKAIQVVDEDSMSRKPAKKPRDTGSKTNGKSGDSSKDAHTPFGW